MEEVVLRKVKPEVSRMGGDPTLWHADQCALSISGSGFHILGGSTCRQVLALFRRSGDSHEVLTLGRYLQASRWSCPLITEEPLGSLRQGTCRFHWKEHPSMDQGPIVDSGVKQTLELWKLISKALSPVSVAHWWLCQWKGQTWKPGIFPDRDLVPRQGVSYKKKSLLQKSIHRQEELGLMQLTF